MKIGDNDTDLDQVKEKPSSKLEVSLSSLSDSVRTLLEVNHPDYLKLFDSEFKTRNWCFLVYPESAPDNWESEITDFCVPWAHGPLHDKDINPTTGELKKPHYHCIIIFDGPTTFRNVSDMLKKALGKGYVMPVVCRSLRGSVRYFCHLDNPEKAPYKPDNCFYYGCDPKDLTKPTSSEKQKFVQEMCMFVIEHNIIDYADLYEYALLNNEDWHYMLSFVCTNVMNVYIRSRRHRLQKSDQ